MLDSAISKKSKMESKFVYTTLWQSLTGKENLYVTTARLIYTTTISFGQKKDLDLLLFNS
jgi:hypothetical protein